MNSSRCAAGRELSGAGLSPRCHRSIRCLRVCVVCLLAVLAGCRKSKLAYSPPPPPAIDHRGMPSREPNVSDGQPRHAPAPEQRSRPHGGELEEPQGRPISTEIGLASWYGPPYHNRRAADGSIFDQNALTAAHRTLPMGTIVRVTNLTTEQSVIAKITDRGPFIPGRTLDLSLAAAKAIGVYRAGVAKVKVEVFANPRADPAGRWCVQIGVFIDPADAIQLKNDLAHRYATARVIEFAGPTGHWVRINPAQPDRATASRIADTIHLPDAEPYLIRTN